MNLPPTLQIRVCCSRLICVGLALIWTVSSSLADDGKQQSESGKVAVSEPVKAEKKQGLQSYLSLVRFPSVKLPEMPSISDVRERLPEMPSISNVRERLPEMPSLSSVADIYFLSADLAQSKVSDLRIALENGVALVPRDLGWWKQFVVVGSATGTIEYVVAFGCFTLATPGGPALMMGASIGCVMAVEQLSPSLVRIGY